MKRWTEQELAALRREYMTASSEQLKAMHPGRSLAKIREKARQFGLRVGVPRGQARHNFKHGECSGGGRTRSVEWIAWASMRWRCYNPRHKHFKHYGGRGITVCERWLGKDGYDHFLTDMGRRPGPRLSLDRIDNSKGYSPDNCRWATPAEQNGNRRNGFEVEIGGETHSLSGWARIKGMKRGTVIGRYNAGVRGEALLAPMPHPSRFAGMNRQATKDRRAQICVAIRDGLNRQQVKERFGVCDRTWRKMKAVVDEEMKRGVA